MCMASLTQDESHNGNGMKRAAFIDNILSVKIRTIKCWCICNFRAMIIIIIALQQHCLVKNILQNEVCNVKSNDSFVLLVGGNSQCRDSQVMINYTMYVMGTHFNKTHLFPT